MRVQLSDMERLLLFRNLDQKKLYSKNIAKITRLSTRTVTDWKRGKYTIPVEHFNRMAELAGIEQQLLKATMLNDWWNNGMAGSKGGIIRLQKYGSLGTPEGRRLGGMNSYANRKGNASTIFTPKTIHKAINKELFAELMGILIGDGGVTGYQVTVATNSIDDYEYGLFVAELIKQLFGLQPTSTKRKGMNCITVTASSVALVKLLRKNGILQSNKIKQGLDIPPWDLNNKKYSIACLRGIFDTDGCVFQECHRIKERTYSYPRWALVSASPYLRESIHKILINLEFRPKIRNNRTVNLESFSDISRYFEIIGTSNPKHLNRFRNFGGVG